VFGLDLAREGFTAEARAARIVAGVPTMTVVMTCHFVLTIAVEAGGHYRFEPHAVDF
jgi:hypothetical protein